MWKRAGVRTDVVEKPKSLGGRIGSCVRPTRYFAEPLHVSRADPGEISNPLSSPLSNGSIGSINGASANPSATSPRRKLRQTSLLAALERPAMAA